MPGLDDIANSAFGQLDETVNDAAKFPGQKLGAYDREANNKFRNKLDAVERELKAQTLDKLEAQADNAFQFVLKSFGLERVQVNTFKPGEPLEPKDSAGGANDFRHTDRGELNMHSGEYGKPPLSVLGTPIFADVKLEYSKPIDVSSWQPVSHTEDIHLKWCLVEVQQTKNIVKTKVQGRDGEVKEYISDGDYMVTLRGAFSSTFMQSYPKEIVVKLISICKKKEPLKVVSEYLGMFGIAQLVIESYHFAQMEGKQNVQRFELQCSSDYPLELKRKKQNVSNR